MSKKTPAVIGDCQSELSKDEDQRLRPLPQAVEMACGHRPALATCLRWCQRGCHGVYLESTMLAGRRLTKVLWVRQFMAECTEATSKRPTQQAITPKLRKKSIDAANTELDRLMGDAQ